MRREPRGSEPGADPGGAEPDRTAAERYRDGMPDARPAGFGDGRTAWPAGRFHADWRDAERGGAHGEHSRNDVVLAAWRKPERLARVCEFARSDPGHDSAAAARRPNGHARLDAVARHAAGWNTADRNTAGRDPANRDTARGHTADGDAASWHATHVDASSGNAADRNAAGRHTADDDAADVNEPGWRTADSCEPVAHGHHWNRRDESDWHDRSHAHAAAPDHVGSPDSGPLRRRTLGDGRVLTCRRCRSRAGGNSYRLKNGQTDSRRAFSECIFLE